jgi:hypothetical protein
LREKSKKIEISKKLIEIDCRAIKRGVNRAKKQSLSIKKDERVHPRTLEQAI